MAQDTEPMDAEAWRQLLRKYIDHVGECEGVDFLNDLHRDRSARSMVEPFTDDEWRTLQVEGGMAQ